jgi:hypothetical protein
MATDAPCRPAGSGAAASGVWPTGSARPRGDHARGGSEVWLEADHVLRCADAFHATRPEDPFASPPSLPSLPSTPTGAEDVARPQDRQGRA